jgi:hypothetical protein
MTTIKQLMLFRETVAVYCENRMEHIKTPCVQNAIASVMLKLVVHILTTILKRDNKGLLETVIATWATNWIRYEHETDAPAARCHIPSNSLFISHPTIRRYIV